MILSKHIEKFIGVFSTNNGLIFKIIWVDHIQPDYFKEYDAKYDFWYNENDLDCDAKIRLYEKWNLLKFKTEWVKESWAEEYIEIYNKLSNVSESFMVDIIDHVERVERYLYPNDGYEYGIFSWFGWNRHAHQFTQLVKTKEEIISHTEQLREKLNLKGI